LPDKTNEELYIQHKEQTERSLKKVVIFAAVILVIIVVGAFFV
jgi:hypothetical protein